ncbi:hypothetical protein GGI25_005141 [Coemansia spiralis]|uniref:Trafficking protein particle complex subunit 2-like protein n=2 Tax=Coemansia TaxID=4863 RepID=A0A9W8KWD7_9FUNG|nr:Sedlin [Coemansia spiralis]KAJ1988781.1 hypothetical protein EDC05_005072 [Coemansia umbellata]KAJ2620036.1 hypothetical protein GGI26_005330 [Coemansia sp. RSA 1358]KAJ2672379.1 hypothetical protein GGI25_005141 [Coemansia spiralis]
MKLHCLIILSRIGNPLYMRAFESANGADPSDQAQRVKYHYLAHTSCDVIEERLSQNKSSDLFLGLLQTVGDMVVYGYVLNTGDRFILITSVPESSSVRTAEIKSVFQHVHTAYISMICNPFNDLEAQKMIFNDKFDRAVDELGKTYG